MTARYPLWFAHTTDPSTEVRVAATRALGTLRPPSKRVLKALLTLLQDAELKVSSAALTVSWHIVDWEDLEQVVAR